MPDAFGLVQAPVQVAASGTASGDTILTTIGAFLQAFLNDKAQTAWTAIAPNTKVVESAWADEPPSSFSTKDLPALFVYRTGETKEEWVGDGILLSTSEITVLWVMRAATQDTQKKRVAFRNAIGKLVNLGIERGRTPGFVVVGDTDPLAATQGSLLYPRLGAWALNYRKSKPRTFMDQMPAKAEQQPFDALEMTLELQEQLTIGLDKYTTVVGTDVKITNIGGTIIDHVTPNL